MPLERVSSYRGSFELEADSGDAQLQMAYQVSDDGITWYSGATSAPAGSFATFGAERTSEGITYGSTFTTLTMDVPRQLIRWGLACRNGAAGVSESCAGSLRIDVRGN